MKTDEEKRGLGKRKNMDGKNDPDYPEHHMIDKEIVGDWTLNLQPKKIIEIERTSSKVNRGPRLIYYWEFQ